MSELNLVDLLDGANLPLKNRINAKGHYAPRAPSPLPGPLLGQGDHGLIPSEPLEQGEQYRFHFDMSRCVGCQCCVVACNEQNNNPASVNWRRVGEIEGGFYPETKRFHLSMACNHCLDPACLEGCPTDAYVKLENGVVKHRAEECIGCGYCSWNCPYGVPQYNAERRIVTKCDMCHSRLKDGELPACVAACPESAIMIEKVNAVEWRQSHTQADAPHVPDSEMTLSTTRITLPKEVPVEMLRANRHRVEPEKPHTSLIFMTVLTQLASGGFTTLWLLEIFSRWIHPLPSLENFLPYGACGMLGVTGVALFAAIFHLGRPLYAYKALKMWKRSWLSREVLFFAVFSMLGAAYAGLQLGRYFWGWKLPDPALCGLGALVVLSGLAGVYASAKIYLVPARPAWNTRRTPVRFFLTGFILGPLLALGVYSAYAFAQVRESLSPDFIMPAWIFLGISAAAGFGQLIVLLSRLFSLPNAASEEISASNFLLIHRFKKAFVSRLALLFLGSFFLPFALYVFLQSGKLQPPAFLALSLSALLVSLLGELLGRYLFFVTVVPKNMPGSFFTQSGGGH